VSTRQQWDIVTSVGLTALWVAAGRAIETEREDRLINDPFAAELVRAADPPAPMPTTPEEADRVLGEVDGGWARHIGYLGVRTRFFDEFFESASAAGVRQAVILAAGLDARAFRLPWPAGSVVYEIDQPKVLEFKHDVLTTLGASAGCEHRLVPVDLRDDWAGALSAAGFDADAPTAWLAEGLLPYLPQDAERRLLDTVDRLSAPGSRLAMEHFRQLSRVLDDENATRMSQRWGMDIRTLVHDDDRPDAAELLAAQGWTVTAEPVGAAADRYDRELDPVVHAMADVGRFVTATNPDRPA
jgi:methyltransferase (TIGR00027 family)